MRAALSALIAEAAINDPRVIVLSGDHGHDFFNALRESRPEQFINCGIIETGMVGIAAGLARSGFFPIIYGLASFIPIKVVEQIKLDFCQAGLRGLFIGDAAGIVYTSMGPSHQAIEDIACLRSFSGMDIYSPSDPFEMAACFLSALQDPGVSYLRVGKSSGERHHDGPLLSTEPRAVTQAGSNTCLVAHGALVGVAKRVGEKLGLTVISVPHITRRIPKHMMTPFKGFIVIEDHAQGGLASAIAEDASGRLPSSRPAVCAIGPRTFSHCTGSHEYVMREHGLDEKTILQKVGFILEQINA